ncbi:MAG: hypothetical protein V4650_02575 [Pseudomonadota bacterium]
MSESAFNNWVSSMAAVAAVLSTVAGIASTWQASRAGEQAEEAKLAAEQTSRDFEALQYRDKQQFELYAKIESLLKENTKGSLVLATTYVSLVKDPDAKGVWCAAVINYARIRETELTEAERNAVLFAKQCLSDAVEKRMEQPATAAVTTGTATAAAPPVVQAPASAWTDKKVVSQGKALGYDIDVFACESGGAQSRARAEQVAKRLAAESLASGKIAHADLGRVRLRWLASATEAQGGYPSGRNQVQAEQDASEQRIAEALTILAGEASGQTFTTGRSASGTEFYLSVFACGK